MTVEVARSPRAERSPSLTLAVVLNALWGVAGVVFWGLACAALWSPFGFLAVFGANAAAGSLAGGGPWLMGLTLVCVLNVALCATSIYLSARAWRGKRLRQGAMLAMVACLAVPLLSYAFLFAVTI